MSEQHFHLTLFKVTGMLSMIATSYMMYEISTDKKKRRRTYFRLMLGMSFIEFCDGLAFFLGPWAIPGGLSGIGSYASCQFQGFLLQASIGSTFYNASLALYYLLSIRYNWSERRIAQKVEPWMHGITLFIAYGTAIACIPLGLYMSVDTVCYISREPRGCQESYAFDGETTCTKGDNATLYSTFFFTIWEWTCIGFTALAMTMIWCGVRAQENKMQKYLFGESSTVPVRKNSRRFMIQGILYVFVFYFSHLFAAVTLRMVQAGNFSAYYELQSMVGLTYPLEGFLNFLVYMRPRMIKYLQMRREQILKAESKESHTSEVNSIDNTAIDQVECVGGENQDPQQNALTGEICLDEQEQDDLGEY